MSPTSQKLLFLFKDLFLFRESGAVLLPDGTALHVKYSNLADIGTFELAGRTTQQYLQLKPGQIAMTNDPYSGGTILSTVTLLMGVSLNDASDKTDLILCYRFLLRPSIHFAATIDEEGLRIPPTPIVENGVINQEMLKAMAAHPLCPDEILPKTLQAVDRLKTIERDLTKALQIFKVGINKSTVQDYFSDSREIMHTVLTELPFGDMDATHPLSDGGKIKMNLEIKSNSITFDFKDTTSSKLFAITEAGTFGACFGALIAFCDDRSIPVNAGSFGLVQVVSPSRSLLSAKYPMSTHVGMTEGLSLTANLVLKTLLKMVPSKKISLSSSSQCSIDIQFENGLHFFDTVPGGTGASSKRRGEDGIYFWGRSPLQSSIEDIENRFPLRISSIKARANSGGRGQNKGGDGLIKTFEILSPATVQWLLGVDLKSEVSEHSFEGENPEINFVLKSGKKTVGASSGTMKLNPGDRIVVLSAGGNGFGIAKAAEKEG